MALSLILNLKGNLLVLAGLEERNEGIKAKP